MLCLCISFLNPFENFTGYSSHLFLAQQIWSNGLIQQLIFQVQSYFNLDFTKETAPLAETSNHKKYSGEISSKLDWSGNLDVSRWSESAVNLQLPKLLYFHEDDYLLQEGPQIEERV